jgi:hypothetical protein
MTARGGEEKSVCKNVFVVAAIRTVITVTVVIWMAK